MSQEKPLAIKDAETLERMAGLMRKTERAKRECRELSEREREALRAASKACLRVLVNGW